MYVSRFVLCLRKPILKICLIRGFSSASIKRSIGNDVKIRPISMSYNIYGDFDVNNSKFGIPILIMHGLFGSKNNWNSLSKAINKSTGKMVLAVDARNHGSSPHTDEFSYFHLVEDIRYLTKKLNLTYVNLIGHSMGGRAVMLYALTYPETVNKLIVVDISHLSSSNTMFEMRRYFEAMASLKIQDDILLSEARKMANLHFSKYTINDDVRNFLLTNLVHTDGKYKWRINTDSLHRAFKEEIMKFPQIMKTFNKPTLFIGGKKSDYLRKEDENEILNLFTSAEFKYLDAGHWLHAEKPKEFLDLITDFVKN